jgi:hypothetical protein
MMHVISHRDGVTRLWNTDYPCLVLSIRAQSGLRIHIRIYVCVQGGQLPYDKVRYGVAVDRAAQKYVSYPSMQPLRLGETY